ncbi:MAG TPA: hypothetical protein VK008_05120 [Sphingobacteriaceae bacterium]|nr:hypothetical protein [Sphingobacteriaceae bacterium]
MEVIALVGPAGTGKSHRATIIAHEYDVSGIIDDGLLIRGSRILAGISAKREATRVAAVRRAIFADPEHRRMVREALDQLQPTRLLILGTSKEMVHRICDALDLPRPARYLNIEDIASPEEIRQARRIRRRQGKHVIPAPTVEVKRSFSGQLIDPIRFLYRSRRRAGEPLVIEKSTVQPTFSSFGRFFIEENVIRSIAEYAAKTIPGIEGVVRTRVTNLDEGVRVQMDVSIVYGTPIVPMLQRAQAKVAADLEHMTALNILSVDITAKRLVVGPGQEQAEAGEPSRQSP